MDLSTATGHRQTPLRECYLAAGAVFEVSTNSPSILSAAGESFAPIASPPRSAEVTLRLWMDATVRASPPWPQPYFGGLDHLVYAGFSPEDSLLIDLRRRRIIGRVSPALATDGFYWKTVIFPALMGIVGPTAGVTALHCGCSVRDGKGLLLVGGSGSGKSTLALALAISGHALLADDWTYFSHRDGRFLAWGLPTTIKLLPDAVEHFPDLRRQKPSVSLNGELAFNVDPVEAFGVRRATYCEPTWMIFLERETRPGLNMTEIPPFEAAARLDRNLPPQCPEAVDLRRRTIASLGRCRSWLVRYGGKPQTVAEAVANLVAHA
ncbi:MAG TPA: hypothetical protein VG204_15540 [Terriglobia bacterium]|nr:hypothetical protein [Terriglobia bacterium]